MATTGTSTTGSISSPGIGSGLDVNALVTSLMQPASQKLSLLKAQEASYQTKVSALGSLQSALSSFQSSLSSLSSASSFLQMSATAGDATLLTSSADTTAKAGSYTINTTQLAQAQSLTTNGVSDPAASIGSGTSTTLTFSFGTISGGTLANGTYTGASFSPNASQAPFSVTITNQNNSLQGIRDAINAANGGVTATIVNDGSSTPNRLVLTSTQTGQTMSMKVDVAAGGDAALTSMLAYDPAGTQNMTQTAAGQNANLTINGLAVTSTTNTVKNAVQGLSMTLLKTGTTTVSVNNNSDGVTKAVNDFVSAYNTLHAAIGKLTYFDKSGATKGSTSNNNGPLIGDTTTQLIETRIQQILNAKLPGVSGSTLTSLADIGVSFQAGDGSGSATDTSGQLAVDTSKLQKAIASGGFAQLASLLATNGTPSDSLITYQGSTSATQPGQYDVTVSRLATQGTLTSNATLGANTVINGTNNTLTVQVDGTSTTITIPNGTYTPDKMAAALQAAINGNSQFVSNGSSVTVKQNGGVLSVTSNRYGSASNVRVTSGSAMTTLFGAGVSPSTDGVDVAGTIGGIVATGSGQSLTGAPGSTTEGLKIQVTGTNLGNRGTINFSQGYATLLTNQIGDFLSTKGAISTATTNLNASIAQVQQQETDWQSQMTQMQNRYLAQFTALDTTMSKLQNTSDYLKQVLGGSSSSSSSSK
ncbi:Flagellar hook-associated protein 2 [Pandoraea terrae]|uniref:Flagellar hook-associated protein 2 n=1 Tax=Pandoraea terrae TaxID=1537710 RepID=A0A5E4YH18_9BURK|nr:flagellar filament capping protein FliD [Pandoraea terrae]VVE47752.1 Flagellar hook-associated protein 2 [Pandoraea terrae]